MVPEAVGVGDLEVASLAVRVLGLLIIEEIYIIQSTILSYVVYYIYQCR